MSPILLSPGDLAISASLIVMDAIISIVLRLGLQKQIAVAGLRMVVQLVAVGYLLRFVFALVPGIGTLSTGRRNGLGLVASSHSSDARAITNPWAGLFCKI